MRRYSQILVTFFLFAAYTAWWLISNLQHDTTQMADFSDAYFVLPLAGAVFGIAAARKWGGLKSLFGRAMIFLSLGLLFQVFGQVYNSVYAHILHSDSVYPSIGDVGFFGAIIMYFLGVYWLGKSIRAKIGLASLSGKLITAVVPITLLAVSYFLFLQEYTYDFSHPVTIFLDFGYPFGDALYISAALLVLILSRKVLGGVMQKRILLVLAALFVQYAADFSFSYTNSRGTHITGDWIDYLYLCAYLVMTLALIGLSTAYYQISAPKASATAPPPVVPPVAEAPVIPAAPQAPPASSQPAPATLIQPTPAEPDISQAPSVPATPPAPEMPETTPEPPVKAEV